MQFAGQRTDMNLKPIGEPDNVIIKLTEDILPEPDAILITGITPQKTIQDGITEAEFLKYFHDKIAVQNTIFVGYNNIRFDDEFLRFLNYRNFYDAYEWSWADNRSRWDMLDVIRMTRALRPEGIEWPFASDGRPSNRLELLTSVNGLEHTDAHDALSDVRATIAVARMIKNKQPKLFEFLLGLRSKHQSKKIVDENKMFVYASGKYPSIYEKTTVVTPLGEHPGKQGVLVFDLRYDPDQLRAIPPAELAVMWRERVEDETKRFPVKTMQFNRCPAIAPMGVLDEESRLRLKIDLDELAINLKKLNKQKDLTDRLLEAIKIIEKDRQGSLVANELEVDSQLYDGFFDDQDKTSMSVVRAAGADEIGSLELEFKDQRLEKLLPLYKARNYPESLSEEERIEWEKFKHASLMSGGDDSRAGKFFKRLAELAEQHQSDGEKMYLLEELQLYGQSIIPAVSE